MPHLYGCKYTRAELLKHVGDISQVARVKRYKLAEGYEEGLGAVDVTTGSGFEYTVLLGRGMDISAARYKGKSLAWRSGTSDQHPAYYDPNGRGWLNSFYGGLVVTCGLGHMGAACEDNGEQLGMHGRISHVPATSVSARGAWVGDEYELTVEGEMRETRVFGENLSLRRQITSHAGGSSLQIHDTVENMGYATVPHMMLYHVNTGFPAVSAESVLVAPTLEARPRDADAEDGHEQYAKMQPPTHAYREKCYFHTMAADDDGCVTAAIVNPVLDGGFGVYVKYRLEQLPWFCQWKMMDEGTYVVGLEPGNALVLGRDAERKAGRLQSIEPGATREYVVEIGVLDGAEEVEALKARTRGVVNSTSRL